MTHRDLPASSKERYCGSRREPRAQEGLLKEEVRDRHSSEEAYAEDLPATEARTAHKRSRARTRLGTLTQKAWILAKGVTHEDCAEVKLLGVCGSEQKPDSPNDRSRGRTEGYTAHRLSIRGEETAQGY